MHRNAVLRGLGVAAFWLLIWQVLSLAANSALILPSPVDTAKSLVRLAGQSAFWVSSLLSLLRIGAGYVAAVLLGTVLGTLTAFSPFADTLLRPIRGIMKATPVASFILLVLLWLRTGIVPAFTSFVMVLPLVWANVQEGVLATDERLTEMASLFQFGRKKTLMRVYLPSIMPHLLAACATGLGFAWKAGVAAEVLARTADSIGKNLVESKSYLETPDMFAWTAVVIALSMLFERVFVCLLARIRGGKGVTL